MSILSDFPQVGDLFLGRYRVVSVLGTGGFARVYRATQTDLERDVAIKVMRPVVDTKEGTTEETLAQIELVEQRFRREAKVISKFRSPCTVVVHDYGRTEGGLLYMTLEFVDGESLADVISREAPLDPERIVRILSQVLESLYEAHSFDILHRDIKPGNIMLFDHLNQTDLVKVLDFGIAKVLEVEEEAAVTEELTSDGVLVGTPRYMSPEQIRGDQLTPASDIYSLGLVAFELLTATKAVAETTTMRIIARHLDPQPLTFPDGVEVPANLQHIVERMLEKDPSQRYESAEELLADLGSWDSGGDVAVTAPIPAEEPPTFESLEEPTDTSGRPPPAFDTAETQIMQQDELARGPAPPTMDVRVDAEPTLEAEPGTASPRWLLAAVVLLVGAAVGLAVVGSSDDDEPTGAAAAEPPPAAVEKPATPEDSLAVAGAPTDPGDPAAVEGEGDSEDGPDGIDAPEGDDDPTETGDEAQEGESGDEAGEAPEESADDVAAEETAPEPAPRERTKPKRTRERKRPTPKPKKRRFFSVE